MLLIKCLFAVCVGWLAWCGVASCVTLAHADELTCMAGCNDSMPKMVTYDRVRVTGANRVARNVYSTERDASGVLTSKGGFTFTHTSAAGLTSTTTVTRN